MNKTITEKISRRPVSITKLRTHFAAAGRASYGIPSPVMSVPKPVLLMQEKLENMASIIGTPNTVRIAAPMRNTIT